LVLLALLFARSARAEVDIPAPDLYAPITATANETNRWRQGAYDVWLLRGNCQVRQGDTVATCREAVLWIQHAKADEATPTKVIAYLEQDVSIEFPRNALATAGVKRLPGHLQDQSWFGRLYTTAGADLRSAPAGEPRVKPAVYHRGLARLGPSGEAKVTPAQFTEFGPGPAQTDPLPVGARRVRAFPRSDVPVQAQWFPSAGGQEWVAVISSGVNLIVDGVGNVGSLDVSTDRMVVWTQGGQTDLGGQTLQQDSVPLELYMEGNIVFRQGDRVIYAERMYYDVVRRVGIVLDAEMLTPAKGYEGMLRLKSKVLQQIDAQHYLAHDALLTSSRMGAPRYYFSSNQILVEDKEHPVVNPLTGEPVLDPISGEQIVEHERKAESFNNFVYVAGIPVFYWPVLRTDLENPAYFVDSVAFRQDQVFGTQLLFDLDAYQLLGLRNPPQGTESTIDVDYLSERGLGGGSEFKYDREGLFGIPGRYRGQINSWGIMDSGLDDLGAGRMNLVPETKFRGYLKARHRHFLPNNFTLTGEINYVTDRNFLEQYYEGLWDTEKELTTGLQLRQSYDNWSWSVEGDVRVNDFLTQTQGLNLQHYWLGQSLFGDRVTWYERTQLGYADMGAAVAPKDPNDADTWTPLPWEGNFDGERLVTRQELDLPLEMGPVKVVPYALGELAHWGEDLSGNDLSRAYFQTGVRASLPFWSVNPAAESQLFNVHGLAHKVVVDAEFAYSDANRDVLDLPLYEKIDEDAVEDFRRRMFIDTFGGVVNELGQMSVPLRFDPRLYAVRAGLGGNVTSPTEIADDLMAVRLGMRHRWQTKRGPLGARRIIDWIELDTNAVLFPKEDRDNFGELIGMVDYDFRWHLGDRFTLLSDGYADFFPDGLKTASVGFYLNRPPRGRLSAGFRTIDGPITANVISMAYRYRLSPKWASSYGASVDLRDTGNVGHDFSVTRIGESLLLRAGFRYNQARDQLTATVMVEPRFLPRSVSGRIPGVGGGVGLAVPPAGAFGLE
jgi:hypothetical protein